MIITESILRMGCLRVDWKWLFRLKKWAKVVFLFIDIPLSEGREWFFLCSLQHFLLPLLPLRNNAKTVLWKPLIWNIFYSNLSIEDIFPSLYSSPESCRWRCLLRFFYLICRNKLPRKYFLPQRQIK